VPRDSPSFGLSRYSRRPPRAEKTSAGDYDMANIASQKKRILRSERERLENRLLTSTVKTHFRRLDTAVGSGDADSITKEQRELTSKIDKAVQKGAMHKNTGARKKAKAARIAAGVGASAE
jgi:small subunit ribosomal protein S20